MRNLSRQAEVLRQGYVNVTAAIVKARPTGGSGSGLGALGGLIEPTSAAVSKYGNALKITSQAVITLSDGTKVLSAEFTTFHGNIEKVNQAQATLKNALDRQTTAMDRYAGAVGSVTALEERQAAVLGLLADQTILVNGAMSENGIAINRAGQAMDATTGRQLRYNELTAEQRRLVTEAAAAQENLNRAYRAGARFDPIIAARSGQVQSAISAAPATPLAYQQLNQLSPQLLRRLQASGLGGGAGFGTAAFNTNIASQGAYESLNITKDLANGISQIQGRFKDLDTGYIKTFTAQVDEAGNIVTKFGGRLSGLHNVITQIGRDFQKVAEYAIATTTIFAAYQQISQSIGDVITLNKSLTQLGVTANLSAQETSDLFNGLADIAFKTATPLKDLVAAADDIALATRRAGQSTTEWQHNILSLTEAVGVFTNLTGKDTVSSTDVLVSSMKQLNLQADQLPSLLNKIAAVAGGQSAAIADITQGLGVMAEAGKQAGLSVDQMIATVQTLSQVTAKSPDEVATAFKNLVGSLTSSGSIKALEKYGISLKDEAGNLRNILDVYTEISKKINTGVIPAADVQALVKAIAGGPRRAPDAAALLGAVGDIQGVTEKSIGATNEALLANQKILDTTVAKLTQIGVEIDKFAYSKFADAIKGAVNQILSLVTVFLQFLNSLPASLISTALKLGGVAVVGRLIQSAFNFARASVVDFNIDLLNTRAELAEVAVSTESVAGAMTGLATATRAESTSLAGLRAANREAGAANIATSKAQLTAQKIKGALGASALLGGVTAGFSIASGDNPIEAASQGLQTFGLGLVAAAPIPQLKILGAALTAVGFLTEGLSNNTKKETAAQQEDAQAVLANVTAYRQAQDTVVGLQTEQDTLGESITRLSAKHKKTSDDLIQLSSDQTTYAQNSIAMISANEALAESFDTLRNSITDPSLRAEFDAAKNNLLEGSALRKAELDATAEFLAKANPGLINPNAFQLPSLNLNASLRTPTTGSNLVTGSAALGYTGSIQGIGSAGGTFGQSNLKDLIAHPEGVAGLFTPDSTLAATFDHTAENFTLIGNALSNMQKSGKLTNTEFEAMSASLNQIIASSDAFSALTQNLQIYEQYIQSQSLFGQFTADQAAQAEKFKSFYGGAAALGLRSTNVSDVTAPNGPYAQAPDDRNVSQRQQLLDRLTGFARTGIEGKAGQLLPKDFIQAAKDIATYNGEQLTTNQLFANAKALAESLEVTVKGLTDQTNDLGAAAKAAGEAFGEIQDQALTDRAQRNAGLLQQLHSTGDKKSFNALFAESEQTYKSTLKLGDAFSKLESTDALTKTFTHFKTILSTLPGFEDATSLSAKDLTGRFEEMFISMGLTAAQARKFTATVLDLTTVSNALADARAILHIDVDTKDAIKKLSALVDYYTAIVSTFGGSYGGGNQPTIAYLDRLKKDLAELNKEDKSNKKAEDYIKSLKKQLLGGSLGGPKADSAKNQTSVSLLDIPDEIANSANEDSLIKQAIANAKKLRNQIPGETKKDKNDVVELLDGTKKVAEVRGVSEELLRKALDELRKKIQQQIDLDTKANVIQRIRVGSGSFAALANVPLNSNTGASVGGPNGPISINLNINGQVLTPAQFDDLANKIGAALKKQIGGG